MSADGAGRDFDWSDVVIVVAEQPATACYLNPAGDIVLRQRGADRDDDDPFLWFAPEHAAAIAKAILEAAALSATAPATEPTQRPSKAKDPTAAERQKRYRERHRNGKGVT